MSLDAKRGNDFDSEKEVVTIGGELTQPREVSLQLLQDVYNELTGKTEELSRGYSKSIRLTFTDIRQLNRRIEQLFEQYHIKGKNCVITVYHENDQKEVYSGFDRFSLHVDSGSSKPVESLTIVYSFLVILPRTNAPKTYKLEARFSSRITVLKKLKNELPFDMPGPLFRVMAGRTAEISIEYVDYVVARTFLDAFDDWIHTVEVSKTVAWINWLRKHSATIPLVSKYSIGALGAFFVWMAIPHYIGAHTSDLLTFSYLLFWSVVSVFSIYRLANILGLRASSALDHTLDLSYIKLTKGDEESVNEAQSQNKSSLLRAAGSVGLTIVLGVVSSLIATYLMR